MSKLQDARDFLSNRYAGVKMNKITYQAYLTGIADRLKNLGISDDEILSAALLCQTINDSKATFDEIDQIFGSKIAVIVLSLSKDINLPNTIREETYTKQLRDAPIETKLIKLCDISANIKELKNSSVSSTKKIKQIRKNIHYLNIIKPDLIKNKTNMPSLSMLISGINEVLVQYRQRPVLF
ncbi:MAG: HD domain-containing protein [Nitrososphaera sp.]|jgi:(p)ppGpp synthase/HD superfamily hydrolase